MFINKMVFDWIYDVKIKNLIFQFCVSFNYLEINGRKRDVISRR